MKVTGFGRDLPARRALWSPWDGKPDSARRAPFRGWQPRASKISSRMGTPVIPAYIRAAERDLWPQDRAYIRRRLGRALGKFADDVVRVSVRTQDVNGPRGGVDRACRIKVVLYRMPTVVVEQRDTALNAAVDCALAAVERAVRRAVLRRRMRGRRRGAASRRPMHRRGDSAAIAPSAIAPSAIAPSVFAPAAETASNGRDVRSQRLHGAGRSKRRTVQLARTFPE